MTRRISRHRTAIGRGGELSRPIRLALEHEVLSSEHSVFDYGCGRGEDVLLLEKAGFRAAGWDPAHRPDAQFHDSDVVNLGYVINVIEDPQERAQTLRQAWDLAGTVLLVAARLRFDSDLRSSQEFSDGCVTRADTFQKFYGQTELRQWIDETLEVNSVPAAPGVFFVFRHDDDRLAYLTHRYRRRRAAPRLTKSNRLYQEHEQLLQPLIDFVTDRARLPAQWELESYPLLCDEFGSVRKASSAPAYRSNRMLMARPTLAMSPGWVVTVLPRQTAPESTAASASANAFAPLTVFTVPVSGS